VGGGAGIKFTIEPEDYYVAVGRTGVIRPVGKPVITKFSAEGYQDGMGDVRGDLFIVKEVVFDKVEPKYIKELRKNGQLLVSWHNWCDWPSKMVWGGYVRGPWKSLFPMIFDDELVSLELYGDLKATIVLAPGKEFGYWFEDVFGLVDCPKDERPEIWWYFWNEDLRANYGWKGD